VEANQITHQCSTGTVRMANTNRTSQISIVRFS